MKWLAWLFGEVVSDAEMADQLERMRERLEVAAAQVQAVEIRNPDALSTTTLNKVPRGLLGPLS